MKQESRHVSLLIVASLIIIMIIEIISGFVLHDHNEIIMQQQQQNQYFRKSISEMDSSNNNNNRRLMEEDEDEERVIEEVNNIINNRNNIITTIQNNDKIVKRTYGEGWNVWDKQSIIKGLYLKCSWTSYRTGGKSLPMCVHPEDDVISTSIRTYGFWNECNHMTNLWLNNNNQDNDIFLDVGANIGACIMHFLIHTNAQIIAFEPHPRNLFCLTSTLSKLENQYQNRVILYPIGLGSSQSTSIIFGLKGNLGHSTISLNINEKRDAEHFHQPELIHIERLDSLLNSEELNGIALMKVDVEGKHNYYTHHCYPKR